MYENKKGIKNKESPLTSPVFISPYLNYFKMSHCVRIKMNKKERVFIFYVNTFSFI